MYMQAVRLKNVRRHEALDLSFSPGTVVLRGDNGAGKTSVIQAVAFALFDALPGKQSDFVRIGAKSAQVEVEFEHDGAAYRVVRSTANGMEMYDAKGKPLAKGLRDCQGLIRAALALPSDADLKALFTDALAPPQGELLSGFGLSPKAREQFWSKVLGLDAYQKVWKWLRTPQGQIESQRDRAQGQVDALSLALDGVDLDAELASVQTSLPLLEEVLQDTENKAIQARKRLEMLQACRQRAEAAHNSLQGAQEEKVGLEYQLEGIQQAQASLVEVRVAQANVRQELAPLQEAEKLWEQAVDADRHLESRASLLSARLKEHEANAQQREKEVGERPDAEAAVAQAAHSAKVWEERVQGLGLSVQTLAAERERQEAVQNALSKGGKEAACPVCGSVLGTGRKATLLKGLEEQLASLPRRQGAAQTALDFGKDELVKAQWSLRQSQRALDALAIEGELRDSREAAETVRQQLETLGAELAAAKADKERHEHDAALAKGLKDDLAHLEAKRAGLEMKVQAEADMRKALARLEARIAEAQAAIAQGPGQGPVDTLAQTEAQYAQSAQKLAGQIGELKAKEQELLKAKGQEAALEKARGDVGRAGKATDFILSLRQAVQKLPVAIGQQAMNGIAALASDYWAQMGKGGSLVWKPDYEVELDGRSYARCSGGEQVAMALACRLAVAAWQAELKWCVLDEPTIHLDAGTQASLAGLLEHLNLEQLIVVTHEPNFEAIAAQVVRL